MDRPRFERPPSGCQTAISIKADDAASSSYDHYNMYPRDSSMPALYLNFKTNMSGDDSHSVSSGRSTPTRSNQTSAIYSTSSRTTCDPDDPYLNPPQSTEQLKASSLYCPFYWTGCLEQSQSIDIWKSHCVRHLEGEGPLTIIECSFCPSFTAKSTAIASAMDELLDHILLSHPDSDQRWLVKRSALSIRKILERKELVGLSKMSTSNIHNFGETPDSIFDFNTDVDACKLSTPPDDTPCLSQTDNIRCQVPNFKSRFGFFSNNEDSSDLEYIAKIETTATRTSDADKSITNPLELLSNAKFDKEESTDEEFSEEELSEDDFSDDDFSDNDEGSKKADIFYAVEAICRLNLGPALNFNRERLIQRLRENLEYILPTNDSSVSSRAGADGSGGGQSSAGDVQQPPKKKRAAEATSRWVDPNDGGNEDDNDQEGRDDFTIHPSGSSPSLITAKLACPFYKNNPSKYKDWRSCPGPGWGQIHRLKEHLIKRHEKPIQCPRCWRIYGTAEDLDQHLREFCECQAGSRADGLDQSQLRSIRSKKRPLGTESTSQRWAKIYMVIFPSAEYIPSPYYEPFDVTMKPQTSGRDLEEHRRRIIESILTKILNEEINNPELVERCTARTIDLYRELYPQPEDYPMEQPVTTNPTLSVPPAVPTSNPNGPNASTMQEFGWRSPVSPFIQSMPPDEEHTSPTNHTTEQATVFWGATNRANNQIIQTGPFPPMELDSSHSSQSRHMSQPSLASASTQFPTSSMTGPTNSLNRPSGSSPMSIDDSRQSAFDSQLASLNEASAGERVSNMFQLQGNREYLNFESYAGYERTVPSAPPASQFYGINGFGTNSPSFDLTTDSWQLSADGLTSTAQLNRGNGSGCFVSRSNSGEQNGKGDQSNEFYKVRQGQ